MKPPRPAPHVWPYTWHRNMAEVMEAEERFARARANARASQFGKDAG